MSDVHAETPAHAAAQPMKSWGDPFSLGLASFGISALVLSTVMAGFIDATSTAAVLSLAVAVGFLTEFVAGLIHFARGETFPGLVFTIFSGFWLSYALLVQFYTPQVVKAGGDPANITGVFLIGWAIVSAYLVLASLRTNTTTIVILTLLMLVFLLGGIGALAGSDAISKAAGYVLVVDALVALYASAALIVNDTWGREALPIP